MNKLLHNLYEAFIVDGTTSIQKTYKAYPDKDAVSITLKFYNSDNELLASKTIKFTRNQLSKAQQKLFTGISYKEIENDFLYAKDAILQQLINNNLETIRDLNIENEGMRGMMNNGFVQSVVAPSISPEPPRAQKHNEFSSMM